MKQILFFSFSIFLSSAALAEFLPQSFTSKFEQESVSILKGKAKKGVGSIEYKYPGQIRFETNTPSTVIFVSNGTRAWYYNAPFIEGEQGEVKETSAKEASAIYIKFFDTLKNGLVSNDYYSVKNGQPAKLIFKAKAEKDLGIREADLSFKGNGQKFEDLQVIELTFNDGKQSKIKFTDLKTNHNPSADRFNFTPPANTKKVN